MKDGDPRWLNLLEEKPKLRDRIKKRIDRFWSEREEMGKEIEKVLGARVFRSDRMLMSEYMTGIPNPAFHGLSGDIAEKYRMAFRTCYPFLNRAANAESSDMEFKGFIFSADSFDAQFKGSSFFIRGSVVSRKDLSITDAGNVRFLYDPDYLRNVRTGNLIRLEQLFWALW